MNVCPPKINDKLKQSRHWAYCVKIPLFYWISIITIAHNQFEQSKIFIEIHWALNEQSSVFSRGFRDVLIYWELHFPWGKALTPPSPNSSISGNVLFLEKKKKKKAQTQIPPPRIKEHNTATSGVTCVPAVYQQRNKKLHGSQVSLRSVDGKNKTLKKTIHTRFNLAEHDLQSVSHWLFDLFVFLFIRWHIYKEEEHDEQNFLRFSPKSQICIWPESLVQ